MLSGDYRFSVSNMDKNWQGINDFLILKVAGETQLLFYHYCLGFIIPCIVAKLFNPVIDNAFFQIQSPL